MPRWLVLICMLWAGLAGLHLGDVDGEPSIMLDG